MCCTFAGDLFVVRDQSGKADRRTWLAGRPVALSWRDHLGERAGQPPVDIVAAEEPDHR